MYMSDHPVQYAQGAGSTTGASSLGEVIGFHLCPYSAPWSMQSLSGSEVNLEYADSAIELSLRVSGQGHLSLFTPIYIHFVYWHMNVLTGQCCHFNILALQPKIIACLRFCCQGYLEYKLNSLFLPLWGDLSQYFLFHWLLFFSVTCYFSLGYLRCFSSRYCASIPYFLDPLSSPQPHFLPDIPVWVSNFCQQLMEILSLGHVWAAPRSTGLSFLSQNHQWYCTHGKVNECDIISTTSVLLPHRATEWLNLVKLLN